jgi:hypothetical protein
MTTPPKDQVEQNYAAFVAKLPELLKTHLGKFALMHDSAIIEFYDTARDAYVAGSAQFKSGDFSIQEVVGTPVDLGYYSHAMS